MRYDFYNESGKLYSHTEYNSKGNEIKEVCDGCDANATDRIMTFEYPSYDAKGNWTKKTWTGDPERHFFMSQNGR